MTEKTVNSIVIPGGSGFLGRLLARHFSRQGFAVTVLSRRNTPVPHAAVVPWDAQTPGPWTALLENAAAVINLTGRSVNCRYTRRNRHAMLHSRIDSTRLLGKAIAACTHPPAVWLNASTATIYKHSFDRPMDETGLIEPTPAAKDAFSIEIARAWEAQLEAAPTPHTRKVAMRMAMVMALEPQTVLPILTRLARLRLAGPMAGGRQFISWIHHQDFCRAAGHLLAHHSLSGPVNLAAPEPLPNADLLRALRHHLDIRLGFPAPRWMLEAAAFFLRTETELLIKSRRVIPGKLLADGFHFQFPTFNSALLDWFPNKNNSHPRENPAISF